MLIMLVVCVCVCWDRSHSWSFMEEFDYLHENKYSITRLCNKEVRKTLTSTNSTIFRSYDLHNDLVSDEAIHLSIHAFSQLVFLRLTVALSLLLWITFDGIFCFCLFISRKKNVRGSAVQPTMKSAVGDLFTAVWRSSFIHSYFSNVCRALAVWSCCTTLLSQFVPTLSTAIFSHHSCSYTK